jgi:hypothetical protein
MSAAGQVLEDDTASDEGVAAELGFAQRLLWQGRHLVGS